MAKKFSLLDSLVKSALIAAILFFATAFLAIAGISFFADTVLNAPGYATLVLFVFFDVFVLLEWK